MSEARVDAATAAQVRTLRQGGMIVADIADRLGLSIKAVHSVLRDEPRRNQRGAGVGAEPAMRRRVVPL